MKSHDIELGISYYGNLYVDCLKMHIDEMIDANINAVVLAVSEYEAFNWFNRLTEIIDTFKENNIRVYWNFWAWGGIFGGEADSRYLHRNITGRQVLTNGDVVPAVCFENKDFREYIKRWIYEITKETKVDGFFWDEPSFYRFSEDSWACFCDECKKKFRDSFKYDMPTQLTDDVLIFRERQILSFLADLLNATKKYRKDISNTICLLPENDPKIGVIDWRNVAKLSNLNVIATDPYWYLFDEDITWFREKVIELKKIATEYNLKSQIWLQLFYLPEEGIDELSKAVHIAIDEGIDSIFAWPFRAAEGMSIESENPQRTWNTLKSIFKSIK